MKISPLQRGACLGLLFLGGCQSSAPPQSPSVRVNRAMSGQSIEWVDRSQSPAVIYTGRLIGIDAPDLGQEPWGKQAQQRLQELVTNTDRSRLWVEVDRETPDRFGRKFIYLWKDGTLINEQLVREGMVLPDTRSLSSNGSGNRQKYTSRLMAASQYARLMGVGIWNPDRPLRTLPSDFRRDR